MTIVDTSVWIEYLRGNDTPETTWLDTHLQENRLGLTDLILCEVLQGVRDSDFRDVQTELQKFHIFATGGEEFAVAAAQNYRALRRKGYTVRVTIDCLIATFCLEKKHSLIHRDRDFDAFENVLGLSVIHP